jgi:nicotinamide mononucleotide (NMN) deamidase PncC
LFTRPKNATHFRRDRYIRDTCLAGDEEPQLYLVDMSSEPSITDVVKSIHASGVRLVLAVAGGGSGSIAALLNVPGASRSVVEALVPYHEQSLIDFLGQKPEHSCSPDTARLMARRAHERARWLTSTETCAGVGCTASLASDRPKRGEHRCFVCVETIGERRIFSLTLAKDARSRADEEHVVDAVILNAIADAFGVPERVAIPLLPGEQLLREVEPTGDLLHALVKGDRSAVVVFPDGCVQSEMKPQALMPGAFNPVHKGHRQLAATAARRIGLTVGFELSAVNVDKPPLTDDEIRRRVRQFAWTAPVWVTRAPTFVEKARLFPGTVFVVGADTAERIVLPRYYGDSAERMHAALAEIRARDCRFLVGGRADALGAFRCVERLEVPAEFRTLFEEIPEHEFRFDTSSTELRQRG